MVKWFIEMAEVCQKSINLIRQQDRCLQTTIYVRAWNEPKHNNTFYNLIGALKCESDPVPCDEYVLDPLYTM